MSILCDLILSALSVLTKLVYFFQFKIQKSSERTNAQNVENPFSFVMRRVKIKRSNKRLCARVIMLTERMNGLAKHKEAIQMKYVL